MALFKEIRESNGLTLKYHRIAHITLYINKCISINILSYSDEKARSEEKREPKYSPYKKNEIYYSIRNIEIPYSDNALSVKEAYNYLKTLDEFKDAEDI